MLSILSIGTWIYGWLTKMEQPFNKGSKGVLANNVDTQHTCLTVVVSVWIRIPLDDLIYKPANRKLVSS